MRTSVNSFDQDCHTLRSEDGGDLPKQWDYLSRRLTEVERGLTILEKKHHSFERKFNIHAHEVTKVQVELSQQISCLKASQPDSNHIREIASDAISQFKNDLHDINSQRFHSFETEINLSIFQIKENVEMKSKQNLDQTRSYIDKAVFQLKELLKKYVREQNQIQIKIDKVSRENSPTPIPKYSSTTKNSRTGNKFFGGSHYSGEKSLHSEKNQGGNQWANSNSNSSTSRVNYLREKLKEFEKINKRYETSNNPQSNLQDNGSSHQPPEDIMQKMRNYKEYLEQTESELEPSNIYHAEQGNPPNHGGKRAKTNF